MMQGFCQLAARKVRPQGQLKSSGKRLPVYGQESSLLSSLLLSRLLVMLSWSLKKICGRKKCEELLPVVG